jgi:transcriptional regulator with XRE-family HTH domain
MTVRAESVKPVVTSEADCPRGHTSYRQFAVPPSDPHHRNGTPPLDTSRSGSTIGQRIAAAREARGWTKAELARKIGKSWRLLHKWENDEQPPARESLLLLAQVLGVTIEELLGVAEGQEPPFAAWREFLLTPQGGDITAGERRMLQSLAWPPGLEPTVTGYVMTLAAIRSGTTRRD